MSGDADDAPRSPLPTSSASLVGTGYVERPRAPLPSLVSREFGYSRTRRDRMRMSSSLVPRKYAGVMDTFDHTVFCGSFSPTGEMYMGAGQDGTIRLYDALDNFEMINEIKVDDVGWSIVDTDYSPDQQYAFFVNHI